MIMRFLPPQDAVTIEDQHSPRAVTKSKTVWNGHIVDMIKDHVVVIDGWEPAVREYMQYPGAVVVVVLRGESGGEELLLQRQHRHPVKTELWEIPAGLLDIPGEDPRITVERELVGEADLVAKRWDAPVDYFTLLGNSTEPLRISPVRELHNAAEAPERENGEATMEYVRVSLDNALTMVSDGRLRDLSTVISVLAAYAARARGWAGIRATDAPWLR